MLLAAQHGNTALHEAAWKGFSQTVTVLCKAKVEKRDLPASSPLYFITSG